MKRTERMKSRAQTEKTQDIQEICNYCIVNVVLFVLLVSEQENFHSVVVGDTIKACYGLHNTVFEIIINFKSEGIPFKFQLARGGKQWDPQQIFIERRTSSSTFTQHDK